MKKFARVSLFVLVAMVLALAIGCKNDSQSDPAPNPKAKFIGDWMSTDGEVTCKIETEKFTTTIKEGDAEGKDLTITGTWTVKGDTVTATAKVPDLGDRTFTMTMKAGESDVMDLPLGEEMGGNQVLVKKTDKKSDLTGTWKGKVVDAGNAEGTIEITKDGEGKLSAELTINGGSFNSSQIIQDGNFFTVNWAENTLGLTTSYGLVSASGKAYLDDGSVLVKNDSQSDPAPAPDPKAKFIGEWRSTNGVVTCNIEAEEFTTTIPEEEPITGTWTVDGDTATARVPTLSDATFTMEMKAGESDVMDLTIPAGVFGEDVINWIFVKKTTTTPDLTGTWKGNVVSAGEAEGIITITKDGEGKLSATLTMDGGSLNSSQIIQDGNFFTVNWVENPLSLTTSYGLVSASRKAYLDDGSVFTKQQ